MNGLCECGCGNPTKICRHRDKRRGLTRGQSQRFIYGHRSGGGDRNTNWKGGRRLSRGYVLIFLPGHSRANDRGMVLEHLVIAEKALGHPLPVNAVVHHVNRIKDDNRNSNLVICQDALYHRMLHNRINAVTDGYPLEYRRCRVCRSYDSPNNLYLKGGHSHHVECLKKYDAERRCSHGQSG